MLGISPFRALQAGLAVLLALPMAQAQEATSADSGYLYIAGVHPSERPAAAPLITTFDKNADWYAKALTGVSEPYPASLRFLEDQGAWWTPFIHPGMTGPYDIRGWHAAK